MYNSLHQVFDLFSIFCLYTLMIFSCFVPVFCVYIHTSSLFYLIFYSVKSIPFSHSFFVVVVACLFFCLCVQQYRHFFNSHFYFPFQNFNFISLKIYLPLWKNQTIHGSHTLKKIIVKMETYCYENCRHKSFSGILCCRFKLEILYRHMHNVCLCFQCKQSNG